MGGPRYSDRFFGPDAVAGVDESAPQEQLDLVAATDLPTPPLEQVGHQPPPAPPWHSSWGARLAVVGALVVGAGAGAYGWDRWRDREVETAMRSSVDVSSEVLMFGFDPGQSDVTLSVRLRNEGQLPLLLTGVTPVDPRLSLITDVFKAVELAADQDFVKVLRFDLNCDAQASTDPAVDEEVLVAHLRTVDGSEHRETLSMNGLGLGYPTGLTEPCSYGGRLAATFRDIYPETTQVQRVGSDAVAAVIMLYGNSEEPQEPQEPEVVEVESPTPAFQATWEPVVDDSRAGAAVLTVTWSVLDCAQALTADDRHMSLELTGRMPQEEHPSMTTAYPSPALMIELVRLAERVCT